MTVPVESIGMTTLHLGIHGVARQTVLPEDRRFELFEVGLVPHVGMQLAPARTPWVEIGLIDRETFRIGLGNELWLTWNRVHMCRIDRLA